ncbi:MAG: type II toxin-antitoxin system prevent-host-death family antitoxin [Oscillospiraceae bacterium]|nr:type II toxin-antitoxin system prevent-host-death family antitoxin [Oscillospiraceae bacterium]
MMAVSMFEAKTNLSRYVSAVESKEEAYIVIMRNGKPAAKIVPFETGEERRIGIAKGKLPLMEDLQVFNSICIDF